MFFLKDLFILSIHFDCMAYLILHGIPGMLHPEVPLTPKQRRQRCRGAEPRAAQAIELPISPWKTLEIWADSNEKKTQKDYFWSSALSPWSEPLSRGAVLLMLFKFWYVWFFHVFPHWFATWFQRFRSEVSCGASQKIQKSSSSTGSHIFQWEAGVGWFRVKGLTSLTCAVSLQVPPHATLKQHETAGYLGTSPGQEQPSSHKQTWIQSATLTRGTWPTVSHSWHLPAAVRRHFLAQATLHPCHPNWWLFNRHCKTTGVV